jgi:hypothetical protein
MIQRSVAVIALASLLASTTARGQVAALSGTVIDSIRNEATAIEVYTPSGRPAEFWGNNCGSVVIWAGMAPR